MPRPLRLALGGVFVVYLGVVAQLVLSPSPALGDRAIVKLVSMAERFGVLVSVSTAEFALNVLLVVPLGLLGGLLFTQIRPTAWVAGVFITSLIVELTQVVGLSARTGSSQDVVANTLGAFVGALLLAMVREIIAGINLDPPAPRTTDPRWTGLSEPPWRNLLIGAYIVYLSAVVYLVWAPNPSVPGRSVLSLVDVAAWFGVVISSSAAERALNVLMLVPLSLLGGLLLRRLTFSDWVVAGFALSATVEIVQRIVLPTRSGSARDIVANTLGSLIGALILTAAWALWTQRIQPHPRGEATPVTGAGTMRR